MAHVSICEIFSSILGESTRVGMPCLFIRLAGCNLRCVYCDTRYAYGPGEQVSIGALVAQAAAAPVQAVLITGGEPLLQESFAELAAGLRDASGKTVLVETNGSLDISAVPEGVVTIMDLKCPGSGACGSMDFGNIDRLRPGDEVKFVLADRGDYEWARACVRERALGSRCAAVLFSPVSDRLAANRLAEWILADGLPVRLNLQLHKWLEVR